MEKRTTHTQLICTYIDHSETHHSHSQLQLVFPILDQSRTFLHHGHERWMPTTKRLSIPPMWNHRNTLHTREFLHVQRLPTL